MRVSANGQGTREINLIGEGATLEGTVRIEGGIRISGRILGELHVEGRAIVAPGGLVEGHVLATEAEVAGRVEGDLKIEKRLALRSTACVKGNIEAGQLTLEEGARFEGECRMGSAVRREDTHAKMPTKQEGEKKEGVLEKLHPRDENEEVAASAIENRA